MGDEQGAGTSGAGAPIKDGASALLATVAPFHNQDNTSTGTGNGILTGGVAQILDPAGTLNRQRETGFDSIPAEGVASGAQQLAVPFNVNTSQAITLNAAPQTVTIVSSTNLVPGVTISIDTGTNQEYVFITAVGVNTMTGIFTKNHGNPVNLKWFLFNQARDAAIGDKVSVVGLSPSMTYLMNNVSNLAEQERSAAGELDGASGNGTNIAAEYEYNGGGPLTNAGLASGLTFDRARNLQAKGVGSATQNAGGAAGATSITVSSAAATNSLQPGQQIRIDRNTGNDEAAYVATNYVSGTAAITLQSALQFTHTTAIVEWDIFASAGPGLNGFTPAGIGIEEEALYNPTDGKYYIERSSSSDAMPVANVVAESEALLNDAGTFDRARNNQNIQIQASTSVGTGTTNFADQINYNHRGIKVVVDVTVVGGAGTLVVNLQYKDPTSGKYITALASITINTISTVQLTIYPGITAAANVSISDVLPKTWRVQAVVGGNAVTFSIGASEIL